VSALGIWLHALPWVLLLGVVAWAVCTLRRNVGLVDVVWSLFLMVAALVFFLHAGKSGFRSNLVLLLVTIWGLRLAVHLGLRNWNAPEDPRYQAIRSRNEPGFVWKSLYLVFGLQALLAFVVSAPLYGAILGTASLQVLDVVGVALITAGFLIETVADAQLVAFRAAPDSRHRVLDTGIWRYSRHPNYFGEFCVWWGFFFMAAATGAWWTVISPLLTSALLMRVSGVTLLEKDIGERRPGYRDYVQRTNAFFPGRPRTP
jgi:steroid 5-alpha reductase family enzyme